MKTQKNLINGLLIVGLALASACGSEQNKKVNQTEQESLEQRTGEQRPEGDRKRLTVTEMLAEMDTDGDGKLSETEVKGPLQNDFSKIDTNKDGFIVEEELKNAPEPQGGDQGQGRPPRQDKQLPSLEEVKATMKSNENKTVILSDKNYVLPTTGQTKTFDAFGKTISGLKPNDPYYGQDGNYQSGQKMSYTDNGDGTVTDNVTGLMWAQDQSIESKAWVDGEDYCESLTLGGFTDWRMPSIKELWSIRDQSIGWPYLDTTFFHLVSKDGAEQREQHTWSSNYYMVNTPESKKRLAFIVNDWTGHIKALDGQRYVRAVRGGLYGVNDFVDNGDMTITDKATGLMWSKDDSKQGMNWEAALAYAENSEYAIYSDWRLPNVKELQSIVDYSGVFPAIDSSIFNISTITNEAGDKDYPYFWTSTSAGNERVSGMYFADYVAFGYAVDHQGEDIQGAGAVRFDTKIKDGPAVANEERINNYIRLVRNVQ